MWQRIYALRAVADTPGNWYLPQLESEMIRILQRRAAIIANHPHPERAYLGNDLLDDIRGLAAYHPANRTWFFAALNEATDPIVVRGFLTMAINYVQPEEFRETLIECLLRFLTSHPEQIDPSVIQTLVLEKSSKTESWLHQHREEIVQVLAANSTDPDVFAVAEQWADMCTRLVQLAPHFEDAFNAYLTDINERRQKARIRRKEDLPDYRLSAAYKHLVELHQRAENDDRQAYQQLVSLARKWRGSIPLRAVATHLLGKLSHKHKVTGILCYLLKYAQDDWDNDIAPLSPVRTEAGEALKDMPSPQVWTEMIDAFFTNPPNVLAGDMLDWIAHVTDMLDGISTAYCGRFWGTDEKRRWFRALAEIDDEQFQHESTDK